MTPPFKQGLAWLWTGFNALLALSAFRAWIPFPGLVFATLAAISCPPMWPVLARRAIQVPRWLHPALWIVAVIWLAAYSEERDRATGGSDDARATTPAERASAAPDPLADSLVKIRTRVPESALPGMTRTGYPKMYARLGAAIFKRGNDLALWAGIAAAEHEACPKVDAIGVSDSATRKRLVWFVNCTGSEQFLVSEAQARAARTRYNGEATAAERRSAAKIGAVAPKSARWARFNEVNVVSLCDEITRRTAINSASVSLAWGWKVAKNDNTGIATIERDYSASNALGGTISSRYRCSFDVDHDKLQHFWVRELDGWRKLS